MSNEIQKKQEPIDNMTFFSHVEELRWHIIRSLLAIVAGGLLVAIFKDQVVAALLFPLDSNFITFKVFNSMSNSLGGPVLFGETSIVLQNLDVPAQFTSFIWLCILGGLIVSFPYIVWEVWRFVVPALTKSEKKYSVGFILAITFLFLLGVSFSYFFVVPLSVNFFYNFQLSETIENNFQISSYMSIFVQTTLAMGIVFLFPILVYFLTKVGIIRPSQLKEYRKHSFVVVLLVSSMITPADIFSMFVAALPLWLLYELSVLISNWVYEAPDQGIVKVS